MLLTSTFAARFGQARGATPTAPQALQMLRTPSNVSGADNAAPYSVLEFASPQNNGLPPMGPGGAGVTYFWRTKYRAHQGYHVLMWYGRADGVIDPPNSHLYYGAHPYPTTENNQGTNHVWEIAHEAADNRNNLNGVQVSVVKDQWYRQALRVTQNGDGSASFLFWQNLESVSNATKFASTASAAYMANVPSVCKITLFDSPWFTSYQHERHSGFLQEYLVVAKAMTEADIITQGLNLQALNTGDSQNNVWYHKKTWASVNDLACQAGTGRSFTRNDSSNLLSVEPFA